MEPLWDENAEKAVLSLMLQSDYARREAVDTVAADDFYRPANQLLFSSIIRVDQSGTEVDFVSVSADLERAGELNRVGGGVYLIDLLQFPVGTAMQIHHHAAIVADKGVLRRLGIAGSRIVQASQDPSRDAAATVEWARGELDQLTVSRRSSDTVEVADLLPVTLDELEQPQVPGIPTGLRDLDDKLGGLRPGTFTLVAARPSVGKSILCLQIAMSLAKAGHGALFLSLEMSKSEVMSRLIAAEASVELTSLRDHRLTQDDWRRVAEAAERIKTWPLAISDEPVLTVTGIESRARDRMRTPRGLGVVVTDYLQLVTPADPRAIREQQVSGMSRGFKLLSRKLGVPVVVAAQLNRGSEQRKDGRPQLSDLRESGSLEQDADNVLMLHRDEGRPGEIELIIAKNRQGPIGSVPLMWAPHYARARSLSREY